MRTSLETRTFCAFIVRDWNAVLLPCSTLSSVICAGGRCPLLTVSDRAHSLLYWLPRLCPSSVRINPPYDRLVVRDRRHDSPEILPRLLRATCRSVTASTSKPQSQVSSAIHNNPCQQVFAPVSISKRRSRMNILQSSSTTGDALNPAHLYSGLKGLASVLQVITLYPQQLYIYPLSRPPR